jgi:hypothetical protein
MEANQQTDEMLSKDTGTKKFVYDGQEFPDTPYFRNLVKRREEREAKGPGTFKEAMQTIAEVAPITGDAIAVYNLPSDLRKAYELMQQGYTEGDIKDIGLGAGLAGLSALGVVPVLGTGAKIAKKGLRATIDDALVQTEDLFRTASGMDGPDSMAMATTAPSRVTGNVADDALPDTSITKIIIGKSGKDHAEKEARYNAAKQELTGGRRVEPDEAQELWNRTGAQEDLAQGDVVYEIPTVNARLKEDELTKTVFPELDFSKKKNIPDDKRAFRFEAAPDAQITVGDIVDFPELFEQAPYLKNITVKKVPIMSQLKGTNAAYDDVENILYLSSGTKKDLMSSTLHELEHAVQKADDFTYRGSNINNFLGPDTGYDSSNHKRLIDARKQVAADLNEATKKYYGQKIGESKYQIIDTMKMLSDVYSPKLRKRFIQIIDEMDERKINNLKSTDVKDFKDALPEHVRDVGKSLSDFDYKFSVAFIKKLTKDPIRTQVKGTKSPLDLILDTIRAPDFQDLTRFDELKQQAIIKYMRDPGEVTARNVQFRFLASQADPSITRVAPRFTEDKSISPGGGQSRSGIPETKTAEQLREEVSRQGVDLTPTGTYLSRPDELALMKGRSATEQTSEAIPVMPINQAGLEARGFDFKPGGEYVNPITKEILTGKKVGNANIKIIPDMEISGGRPMASFNVTDLDVSEVGSAGKGKTQILVNLVKPTKKGNKAGWSWDNVESEELEGVNTLVSVLHKNKHYFTLETDFSKGAELKTYPKSQSEPRLRPTAVGELDLQEQVGTIRMKDKTHPVYRKITAFASGGLAMAEGGAVPMDRQMDMFEEGGLEQDGGTIDPVSGNDVPFGSSQEEVRDDIPAQLSEGEFVFPADVVRYIGLEKLMQMRQEAKMGLSMMERMGQMGNSEEAIISDDIPFDLSDLDIEDDMEYNVGGFVPATPGQQQFGVSGFQQAAAPTTGVAAQPVQAASAQFMSQPTRPQQASVPTVAQQPAPFTTFIGPGVPEVDYEFGTFKNESGQTIQLKIKKGSKGELLPGEVLPEGYKYVDPTATQTEAVTTTPTSPQSTSVRDTSDDDERRRKEEEARFGPGGGRVGVGGTIYGVSFDGPGGLKSTIGQVMGRTLGGKDLGADITVRFQNEDDIFILNGTEYNQLKTVIDEQGANSNAAQQTLDKFKGGGKARLNAEEVIKNLNMMTRGDGILEKLGIGDDNDEIDKVIENYREHVEEQIAKGNINSKGQIINPFEAGGRGGTGRGTTLGQRPKSPAFRIQEDDPGESGATPPAFRIQEDDPGESGATPSSSSRDFSAPSPSYANMSFGEAGRGGSSSSSRDFSSQALGDKTSGRVGFDEGGLARKPKSKKTKKMKRGGLASKK